MTERSRRISYFLAYAVATIPLWHYIRDGRILALMVAVVTFAYINVVLSTVQAAQPILSSEKAKTPLPRWLPDKPKYQKWWLLVRHTLKWHLLLIPPKMGLALGFVQWLWIGQYSTTSTILKPFFYASASTYAPIYSQWETLLLGASVIIIFSVLENGLINALTSLAIHPSRVIILRLLLALSIIGMMSQFRVWYSSVVSYHYEWCRLVSCPYIIRYRLNFRIGETIETGFFTIDDTGILLAANVMRPIASYLHEERLGYWSDNRPFVARQIVAGLLGMLLYAGATWAVLWFVEDET
jgi:hypothetical protein